MDPSETESFEQGRIVEGNDLGRLNFLGRIKAYKQETKICQYFSFRNFLIFHTLPPKQE